MPYLLFIFLDTLIQTPKTEDKISEIHNNISRSNQQRVMYSSLTRISTPLGSRRHVWIPRILTTRLVTNSVQLHIVSIIAKVNFRQNYVLCDFKHTSQWYFPCFEHGAVIVLVFTFRANFRDKVRKERIIYFFRVINISRQFNFAHMT